MNNIVGKIAVLVLIVSSTTACTSKLAYRKNFGDPASPGDKELVFSLRNSTILISQSGLDKKADSKQAADSADIALPINSCAPKRDGETQADIDVLRKCLSGVSVQAIANRDKSTFYVAQPVLGTTLKSTAIDADPFMIKSIAIDYKNPMVSVVSSAGAGAVAGFGVGGPWGAAIGGLLGAGGPIAVSMAEIKWYERGNVCKEDIGSDSTRFDKLVLANKMAPQLFLPVALPYETSRSLTDCWHPLPNRSHEAQEVEMQTPSQGLPPLSGWFYRIVFGNSKKSSNNKLPPVLPENLKPGDKLAPPFQERDEYFGISGDKETFPVSACRSVEVQITWWEMLKERNDPVKYKYPTMVADSGYVQAVRLPKNGTVYLLPVCGGYASPTQSSSSLGELIDVIVKQAQAIKDAQNKYEQK